MSPLDRFRYLRELEMPGIAKSVLYSLVSHADADGGCYLLQSTLARETGFSDRSVRRAITYLVKHGLCIHMRKGHHASTFQLTLEAYRKAKSRVATQSTRKWPNRPPEVAPKKKRTQTPRKPRRAYQGPPDWPACSVCKQYPSMSGDSGKCSQCWSKDNQRRAQ